MQSATSFMPSATMIIRQKVVKLSNRKLYLCSAIPRWQYVRESSNIIYQIPVTLLTSMVKIILMSTWNNAHQVASWLLFVDFFWNKLPAFHYASQIYEEHSAIAREKRKWELKTSSCPALALPQCRPIKARDGMEETCGSVANRRINHTEFGHYFSAACLFFLIHFVVLSIGAALLKHIWKTTSAPWQ